MTVATGNKFQKEIDYDTSQPGALAFIRYYNSDPLAPKGSLGPGWRDTFDRQIVLSNDPSIPSYSGPLLALAYRPDGRTITFNVAGPVPMATDPDTVEVLTQPTPGVWLLTTKDDTVETYVTVTAVKSGGAAKFGQLTQIQERNGVAQTLAYDATQNLHSVTDSFGHTLTFTYDASNRLSTLTDPSGNLTEYTYWPSPSGGYEANYLENVYYPGPTLGSTAGAPKKQYYYSEAGSFIGLSSIVDEGGVNYAFWAYDSNGRAVASYHGSSPRLDTYNFSYTGTGGTGTTVTTGAGESDVYTFSMINGVPKYSSIVTNGSLTQSATYDTNGNFTSITDRIGITTNYSIDARGLEESRTEAAGTAAARTVTTEWHPSFHLPTQISIAAGGAALSSETMTYDGSGNKLTDTLTDPSTSTSRTWTYTYDSYGHVLTALGPRTDVQDLTQYTYYNCTTGAQCGRLESVTNALGQITVNGD